MENLHSATITARKPTDIATSDDAFLLRRVFAMIRAARVTSVVLKSTGPSVPHNRSKYAAITWKPQW